MSWAIPPLKKFMIYSAYIFKSDSDLLLAILKFIIASICSIAVYYILQ